MGTKPALAAYMKGLNMLLLQLNASHPKLEARKPESDTKMTQEPTVTTKAEHALLVYVSLVWMLAA